MDFWQLGEDKEPAACLTGAQYWQRKAEGEESDRPMPPVSTLLRSHPSEPHVTDPIMVLGKRIRQAAHPVVGMKTDQIQTDIPDIVFVFIFVFQYGVRYE